MTEHRHTVLITFALAVAALVAVACAGPSVARGDDLETTGRASSAPSRDAALASVDDCDGLRTWLVDALVEQWVDYGMWYGYGQYDHAMPTSLDEGSAARASAAPASADASGAGAAGPSSYTGTNNQEAAVDEMDIVKTDGRFIYMLQGNTLSIVRSFPTSDAGLVATLKLPGYGSALFLRGDRVVAATNVYNQGYYGNGTEAVDVPFASGSATRLTFVDVSDRAAPHVEREIDIEGWLTSGRLVGSQAWFVTSHTPTQAWNLWNEIAPKIEQWPTVSGSSVEDQLSLREQTRAMLRPLVAEALASHSLDEFLPQVRTSSMGEPHALASCGEWMRPGGLPQLGTLAVTGIDLDDLDSEPESAGVLASGWQVYASEKNLYVVGANTNSWWWWGGWQTWKPRSVIHKFELDPDDGPRHRASGEVDGWMLNQFSMSEHDGYLRVATTTNDTWMPDGGTIPGSNHVFVLEEHESRLSTVGALRGIAPGERIYSARMMGERGYMVTFRQVDPLFTLDLSDPSAPRVIGELKVPGYSSYLHPMDEDHLVTVGMAGTETGQITGMAISVFDVSDFESPRLVQQHELTHEGWSWSPALYDHHAFTYRDGALAVPVSWYDSHGWFSGLEVLSVDAERGIEPVGRVDHSPLAVESCRSYYASYQQQYAGYDYASSCTQPGYAAGWAQMQRSIFIDDTLVSISTAGMMFSPLETPDDVLATIALPNGWW